MTLSEPSFPPPARCRRSAKLAVALVSVIALGTAIMLLREWAPTQTLLTRAEQACRRADYAQALLWLERIPDDGTPTAVAARCLAGDVLLERLDRLTPAEEQFRRALAQDPVRRHANDQLAYLMHLATRDQELATCELRNIRAGRATLRGMKLLSLGERLTTDELRIRKAAAINPRDPAVLLGLAAAALMNHDMSRAEECLRAAARIDPHPVCVDVRLGDALLMRHASDAELRQWHRALPPAEADEAGLWLVRAQWVQRAGDLPGAARCYWEALRRNPNLRLANTQLGQILTALQDHAAAERFLDRARRLAEYDTRIESLNARRMDRAALIPDALQTADLAESLGLLIEAYGWHGLTLELDSTVPQALQRREQLQSQIAGLPLVRTIDAANPALEVDLSALPIPDWNSIRRPETAAPAPPTGLSDVAFEDRAALADLEFYFISQTEAPGIYETTGGGVAALDYDADGWPDVYFTQGGCWPPRPECAAPLDQLFRNRRSGQFTDVTGASHLVEDRFSQGVSAGDYDNDGFADLYVANLNGNRLYRNNGDGTFEDVTDASGVCGSGWTTSCTIADLNGDALPDIYAVNYLDGPALTTACREGTRRLHDCTPAQFPAAQDRLFLNLGDGRFADITDGCGIAVPNGKGLGIVVADFDWSGRRDVFIANDGVPNFLFQNQAPPSDAPHFSERALSAGAAVNGRGETQAGMGIATGDLDGNGLLDLFVTNFYRESNTLYLQQPGSLFFDATHSAGLRDPSLLKLGFGAQCVDGELDGLLDLVVTNGHIQREDDPRVPFEMEPQYFRNRGAAKFEELPGSSVGRFFTEKRRGRGMARLDWNRDGREDLVISHLGAPAALLTNITRRSGRAISISLRGVASNRDAIGAIVTLRAGELTITRQLTAGDGYQASNERLLVFGLGNAEQASDVEIVWPSGLRWNAGDLAADVHYLFVEARSAPLRLPTHGLR